MTMLSVTHPHRRPDDRPRISHTFHLREFNLPDGRKITADRRSVAFICEGKPEEFAGKTVTIVGFRTLAKACPVEAIYADVKAWWTEGKPIGVNGGRP